MQGKPKPSNIGGFTPKQLFFLGVGRSFRPQGEAYQAQNDPHAVARFRVNGPLSNMPEFAEAFKCKQKDNMVRTDICHIW
jgi:endothelin-converting enzyme/putative endopeptidase